MRLWCVDFEVFKNNKPLCEDWLVMELLLESYKGFKIETLNKYLDIKPEEGLIYWRVRCIDDFKTSPNPKKQCDDWNRKFSNKVVGGCYDLGGKLYRRFTLFGKTLFVGKVIYLYYYGYTLDNSNGKIHLDHINGNSLDDSAFNLRYISNKLNVSLKHKTKNKNGYVGVECCNGRFRAKIKVGDATVRSELFNSAIEAYIEYILMRKKYILIFEHPFFEQRNIRLF